MEAIQNVLDLCRFPQFSVCQGQDASKGRTLNVILPSSKYRPLRGTAGRSIDLASGVLVLSGSFDDADGCTG